MIGKRLEMLRKERKMSQRELAAILGVTNYTVSAYENDRSEPADEIKVQLARLFDVSLDYLMGLVDQPLSLSREEQTLLFPSSMTASQREFVIKLLSNWEAGAGEACFPSAGAAAPRGPPAFGLAGFPFAPAPVSRCLSSSQGRTKRKRKTPSLEKEGVCAL